jgi:tetratricopeptide (TPR) repeat protein
LLVGTEMHEAAEVHGILRGSPLTLDKVAEPLNAKPQRLVATESGPRPLPQVIGWGTWARFFQRNLVFAAQASASFLNRMLSLKDEARELRGGLHESFSRLELWPAESLTWLPRSGEPATDSPVRDAEGLRSDGCARGLALTRDAPERVVPIFWSVLQSSCPGSAATLIPQSNWLRGLTPAGTALMPPYRSAALPPRTDTRPLYAAMHEMAPFDPAILREVAPPSPGTSAQVRAFYGPLTEYDLVAMKRLAAAQREDPTAYRALLEKIAALVPFEYLSLGDYLADLDHDDEAAAAYEKAIEKAPDRVGVSHHVQWLVGYYLDRSRVDRAREVAQMAADVYSGGGLETMAYFQERTGHYAEAEDWRQKTIQRYGKSAQAALDEFYIRYEHRIADGRFGGRSVAALAKVFPGGLERVSLAQLTAPPPPEDGVRMEGDTVVAINGYRVHNEQQARVAWTFDDRPDWTVILWRQGRYVEEKGRTKRMAYGPISRRS